MTKKSANIWIYIIAILILLLDFGAALYAYMKGW